MPITNPAPDSFPAEPKDPDLVEGTMGTASEGYSPFLSEEAILSDAGEPSTAVGVPDIESVIDGDQRTPIQDTQTSPWRMVCWLQAWYGSQPIMFGSGWLAGPSTVITAGHVVYFPNFSSVARNLRWATAVDVIPGRNGSAGQRIRVQGEGRFFIPQEWYHASETFPDPNYDLAGIRLPVPIGTERGTFRFGHLPSDQLAGKAINVTGYPTGFGEQQFNHKDRIIAVHDGRIFYRTDTTGGQSGAPAWLLDSPDGQPLVVATHTYNTTRTPAGLDEANSGTRLSPSMLQEMKDWIV